MTSPRRIKGEILEWNSAKGFGYAGPKGGSAAAQLVFVPKSSFSRKGRDPKVGDTVHLDIVSLPDTPQNRKRKTLLRADRAEFVADAAVISSQGGSESLLLGMSLLYLAIQGVIGYLFHPVIAVFAVSVAMSLVTFGYYGEDKAMAKRQGRRVPERQLQILAVLGGWPGAAAAQSVFRHKTKKESFQATFMLMIAANIVVTIAAIAFLVISGQ